MTETDIARIRFGYGFGPNAHRTSRAELVSTLTGPDRAAARNPAISLTDALAIGRDFRAANQEVREGVEGAQDRYETARAALRQAGTDGIRTTFARIVDGDDPLRERLTWFWADHFTIGPTNPLTRAAAFSFVDDAIRPFLTAPFAEMLKAVIRHPSMLVYLDQHLSIGPDSPAAARTGRGLNENLARELLELHTMGVGSGYSQADVTATAELLTGLSFHPERGFLFRPRAAQPGTVTIMGETFGSERRPRLADIDDFLDDLAVRPETARHLAQKLAVHFTSPEPDTGLVAELEATYRESGGDLGRMTRVLLDHPQTADQPLQKVKTPFEFIASTMVAFGIGRDDVMRLSRRDVRRMISAPLAAMGQPFMRPNGPDGWSEDSAYWITPQGLATRISWAAAVADRIGQMAGDPREFLDRTLGAIAGDRLRFAVSAAETRAEGVALVLASAEFNRR